MKHEPDLMKISKTTRQIVKIGFGLILGTTFWLAQTWAPPLFPFLVGLAVSACFIAALHDIQKLDKEVQDDRRFD